MPSYCDTNINGTQTTITTQIVHSTIQSRSITVRLPNCGMKSLPNFSPENKQIIVESWPYVEKKFDEVIVIVYSNRINTVNIIK